MNNNVFKGGKLIFWSCVNAHTWNRCHIDMYPIFLGEITKKEMRLFKMIATVAAPTGTDVTLTDRQMSHRHVIQK